MQTKGFDSSSFLYATPELGEKVSEYASDHSTVIPKHITDYHASSLNHEKSLMLSSNFQSQLNIFIANTIGAKRVLEVGVYLGYSCMVWSHAVGPDGHVTGLEFVEEYAKMAEAAFARNNIKNVELIVGAASDTIPELKPDEPYDLVFVDADKPNYGIYLSQILAASKPGASKRLLRPGALIIADNVLRAGHVVDSSIPYDPVLGERTRFNGHVSALKVFNEQVKAEPRLQSVMLPLWDGVTVMRLVD